MIVAKIDSIDNSLTRNTLKMLLLEQAFLLYANTLNPSLKSFTFKRKNEVTREIEQPLVDEIVEEKPTINPKVKATLFSGGGVRNHFASVPAKFEGSNIHVAERGSYSEVYLGAAISYSTSIWGIEVGATYGVVGIVNSASSSSFRRGSSFTLGGKVMYNSFTLDAEFQRFSTNVEYQAFAVEAGYLFGAYGPFLGYRTFGDITGVTPINGRSSAVWKAQADEITAGVRFNQRLGSLNLNVRGGLSFLSFDSEAREQSLQKNIQRVSTPTPFVQIVFGVPITLR